MAMDIQRMIGQLYIHSTSCIHMLYIHKCASNICKITSMTNNYFQQQIIYYN